MGELRIADDNFPRQMGIQERFPGLRLVDSSLTGGNIGGRFAPPPEFDMVKYASAFHAEGNEVLAMQNEQPILGTNLIAEGWKVWRYPDKSAQPKRDDTGKVIMQQTPNPEYDKDKNPTVPKTFSDVVYADHPLKGQPYKVPPLDRDGQTYILMYRPIDVQEQVNEVCGQISIEQMVAEVKGDTIGGVAPQDPGMLTESRLPRTIDRDIEADRAAEANLGRSTVVHSSLQSRTGRVTRQPMRVSR